jgi:hypothetical protein
LILVALRTWLNGIAGFSFACLSGGSSEKTMQARWLGLTDQISDENTT